MDYEKRYEEALERAKELHGTVAAERDFLADIFPELAESEDERIREWLITQLQNNYKGNYWATQAIAYLEKQKEHQNKTDAPEEKSVGGNFLSSHKGMNIDEIAQDYVDGVKEYNSEPTWDLVQTAVCYGYHYREQKEQKPADDKAFEEWINDWWKHNKVNNPDSYDKGDEIQFDERGFKNFCRGIRNMYVEQKPSDLPAGFYYIDGKGNKYYSKEVRCKNESGGYVSMKVTDKEPKPIPKFKVGDRIYDRRDSYNRNVIREVGKDYYINAFAQKMDMAYTDANFEFLEHLDNDLIDSKPAEWSKNDTVFLNEITDFFENKTVRLQHDLDMYAHWLKSLPERFVLEPKQEWSEEDERLLNIIIDILDKEEHNGHLSHEDLISSVKLIKSLRPSWKPSGEQMLKGAVEGEVEWDNDLKELFVLITLGNEFKEGQKVKIIIVKEDKE